MHQHGQRMTEQRRLVLEAIEEAGQPICVPHILTRIQQHKPNVNKSTVYRTVEALEALGIISSVDLGAGRTQYELRRDTDHHHHLICVQCDASIEIDDTPFQALREYIRTQYGFEPDLHHLGIQGRCARCASTGQ